METVLIVGINTRSVSCSLKRSGYRVYSVDYFGCMDLQFCTDFNYSFLKQEPGKSCGYFTEDYKSVCLEKKALEHVDEVDHIICTSGVNPDIFPAELLRGNPAVCDDKMDIYQILKGKFKQPLTYLAFSYYEAEEIIKNHPNKRFIIKPNHGAGGYGVRLWPETDIWEDKKYLIQEYLPGENISASLISNGYDSVTISTSKQIIGDKTTGQLEPFGYSGNQIPCTDKTTISNIAEEVAHILKLKGSVGIDFISFQDDLYLIEVNPRIQGTFECVESSTRIDLGQAHLDACQGRLINKPIHHTFAVKIVLHAPKKVIVGNLALPGVYDIPRKGVIIEKGEPVCTILKTDQILENAQKKVKNTTKQVYSHLRPFR